MVPLFWRAKQIDDATNVGFQAVNGLYAASKRFSKGSNELKSLGFTDEQVPYWMAVEEPDDDEVVEDDPPAEAAEALPAEALVTIRTLGGLPIPRGTPIVDVEASESSEAPSSDEAGKLATEGSE